MTTIFDTAASGRVGDVPAVVWFMVVLVAGILVYSASWLLTKSSDARAQRWLTHWAEGESDTVVRVVALLQLLAAGLMVLPLLGVVSAVVTYLTAGVVAAVALLIWARSTWRSDLRATAVAIAVVGLFVAITVALWARSLLGVDVP